MKGISSALTFTLLIGIVMVAITIVLSSSKSVIESQTTSMDIKNAENVLVKIDDAIREITSEGINSSRLVEFSYDKKFDVLGGENSIEFSTTEKNPGIGYLSRIRKGSLMYLGGNDVSCYTEGGNLVMENTYIKAVLQKANGTVNTAGNIVMINEKTYNTYVSFVNSSVIIDNNISSSQGSGYSEILRTGTALPECTVHFSVNSTYCAYDIYYKLYAGADFIEAYVDNIR